MLHATYGLAVDFVCGDMPKLKRAQLLGRAGTGKSFGIKLLKELAESRGKRVKVCAYTNEIAAQLPDGETIHRAFNLTVQNNRTVFKNDYNPIYKADLVIIDEYTLMDKAIWGFVNKRLQETPCSVLLVGDPYQLPAVRGNPNIIMTANDTVELMTQYRNPEMGDLIDWFIWHIENDEIPNVAELKHICSHGHITDFIGKDGSAMSGNHPMIIGYRNKLFHSIDEKYAKLNKDNWRLCTPIVPYNVGDLLSRNFRTFYEKDVIPEYSLTVHKSQGRSFEGSPLVLLDDIMKAPIHIKTRLLYVACTRGTKLPTLVTGV